MRRTLDAELAALPVALRFDASRLACAQWACREELLGTVAAVPLLASRHPDEAEEDPDRVVLFEDVRPYLVPLHGREAHVTLALLAAALLGVRRALESLPSSHPLVVVHATAAATPEALADFADFGLATADAPTTSHPEPPHVPVPNPLHIHTIPETEPPHPLPGGRAFVHSDAASTSGRFGFHSDAASTSGRFGFHSDAASTSGRFGFHTPPLEAAAGTGSLVEGGPVQRQLARALLSAACERYPDEPRLAAALHASAHHDAPSTSPQVP